MTPRSQHDRVVDRLAANANTVYRECKLEDFLVYSREHKLYDSKTQRGLPGEYINAELNRLSLNVLSLGNAKLMDEFFPAFLPYALALSEQCRALGITLTFYPFITQ